MPDYTIQGAHMVHTSQYVQITGKLKQSQINVSPGDAGGEYDPHGADGKGNPIGGIVLNKGKDGKVVQFAEWTQFIGNDMVSSPNAAFMSCIDYQAVVLHSSLLPERRQAILRAHLR
jgi:hypothetical protein